MMMVMVMMMMMGKGAGERKRDGGYSARAGGGKDERGVGWKIHFSCRCCLEIINQQYEMRESH